jgi:ABC-type Fe3+/spermidine/putrescine transport system ATPase subunit
MILIALGDIDPSGCGKTSLLKTLPAAETLCVSKPE